MHAILKLCRFIFYQDEKNQILNIHNNLRRRVAKGQEGKGKGGGQPAAANIFELQWDETLAKTAQRY